MRHDPDTGRTDSGLPLYDPISKRSAWADHTKSKVHIMAELIAKAMLSAKATCEDCNGTCGGKP